MQINDRVFISPFPIDHEDQRRQGDDRHPDDKMRFEPIFTLPFVEDNLQRPQSQGHESKSDVVDMSFGESAPPEVWRILDQSRGEQDRQNSDWDVDKKDPAPAYFIDTASTES